MATLYAAFSEYGDIWPTTIRRTEADAIEALKQEPNIDPANPFQYGVGLASFLYSGNSVIGFPLKLSEHTPLTWLHGGWAEAAKREAGK